ncbi:MAG: hypothetical protein JW959_05520, partial [Pirellulales bacterium]|nr:hypothetical protein [Pirellulales bacterium]
MTKLLYVTAAMPFGGGEEFLIAEADELRRQGVALLIVPRSPAGRVVHLDAQALAPLAVRRRLWSPRVIACAACQALRRPRRFVQILSLLQLYPPGKNLLKNLLVLPKGIWLGVLAGRWRADHIHAHWATTTSTMAMIAGHWSGIPWSFTAHRGGIVEENLLGPKAATAAFVRCISRVTQRMLAEKGAVAERVRILHMGVVLPDAPS